MRPAAMRAMILDFHGVIVNDEARQFQAFAQALAERGVSLTARMKRGGLATTCPQESLLVVS